jgi:hypothetical protein
MVGQAIISALVMYGVAAAIAALVVGLVKLLFVIVRASSARSEPPKG